MTDVSLRALADAMGRGYALCELVREAGGAVVDHRYLECNAAFGPMTGVPAERAQGRRRDEVFPRDPDVWEPDYQHVCETGMPMRFERHAPGLDRWFEVVVLPQGGDRFAVVFEETTARHRSVEVMQKSEARLRALAAASADVIYRMSPDWREMRQLDGRGFLLDTTAPDASWLERYVHPADRARVTAAIDAAVTGKSVFEQEHRVLRADGSLGWTFSRAVPLLDDAGEIVEWIGAASDVTTRHQAAEALRRSEARQAFLVQLHDRLYPLADPEEIQYHAAAALGEFLHADRAGYAEDQGDGETVVVTRNWARDVAGIEGRYRYADYGPDQLRAFRAGRTHRYDDTANDPGLTDSEKAAFARLQIGAALNVPLLREGRLVAILFVHCHLAHTWTPGEVQITEDLLARTWDAVERARAEAALRRSEERYRTLFETMGQGFALDELVRDAAGRVVDVRMLELNPAFERLFEMPVAAAQGRTLREVFPEIGDWWVETYERIVRGGRPERFEHEVVPVGRWYQAFVYPVGGDRFIVLYEDVTDRKHVEAALQRSEEQQRFLMHLNDTLRPMHDAAAIEGEACRLLGEHLQADRAYYARFDHARGVAIVERDHLRNDAPSLQGTHPIAAFGAAVDVIATGRPFICADAASDARIGDAYRAAYVARELLAVVAVPIIKNETLVAAMCVTGASPRRWTPDEVSLLGDVAERTWEALQRASAEAALRESEERMRLLVGSVTDYAIFTLDLEGRITSWNDGACRLTGWTAEEILGQPAARFYPPDEAAKVDDELQRALADGRSEDESWRVRKDGTRFWCDEVVTPLRDGRGTVVGFTKVSRDLTERRHAEELVRSSEERLRLVMESVADYAIVTLGLDGRIATWNAGAETLFGHAGAEAIGQPVDLLFVPEDRDARVPEAELRRARERGRAEDERWHLRRDGSRVYASGVTNPLRVNGVMVGYVKVARDLTDRKRMEDALRRTREDAEAANRAKDEFLAMLGHELRNPLAPIVTAMELLRLKGTRLPELDIVDRQLGHMRHLVDDLMDVSRITRGKLELDRQPMDLHEAVERAMEQVGPLLEQRRNRVEVQLPWRGPVVDADRNRISQVLANLLTNASKYSEPGSRIVLRAESVEGRVRITVADEGAGIPAAMLEQVFEPFVQQGQSLERSKGGLGLGLAIVKSLVEAHGGTVRAESEGPGRGSRFLVELPLHEGSPARPWRERRAVPREQTGEGRRVLIVDDNADAAGTLRTALEQLGYVVDVAGDGPSALEHAWRFRPAAILLDIGLPFMDGYEVARRLRESWVDPEPPRLLAVTGYGQAADRERSRAAGFDQHLVKPINLQQLKQVLEDELRN